MPKRCLVEFTDAGYEALKKISQELGAKEVEVLGEAFRLFKDLFGHRKNGYRILIKKDKDIREIKIPLFARKP